MTGVKHTGMLTLKRALKVLSARLKRVGAPFFRLSFVDRLPWSC